MPVKKRVSKEKVSKRGKGDVKQSVKVSVKIGETKPRRKRQYRRKPKGEGGDLARVGETRTLYGNLPPQTITVQQQQPLPQLPSAFQEQPKIAGLLEDVKRERQNLLEDIKRETQRQISKAQGEEQRGELARIGWIEPVEKPLKIEQSIQTTAPSFADIANQSQPSQPIIEEVTGKRGRRKGSKNKPKMTEGLMAKPVVIPKGSKLPVPDIEKLPLSTLKAESYNLL